MRYVLMGIVVVGLAIGVGFLREELETRHVPMPRDSQLTVDATASVRGPREIAPSLARGLVASCLVETAPSSQVQILTFDRRNHFRFVAQPAVDDPDQRQLRGCLEDLRVPWLLVSVQHMSTVQHAT